eukprot:scaffold5048_cov338-Prasinococcus_capsulatus_cf.AAC.11
MSRADRRRTSLSAAWPWHVHIKLHAWVRLLGRKANGMTRGAAVVVAAALAGPARPLSGGERYGDNNAGASAHAGGGARACCCGTAHERRDAVGGDAQRLRPGARGAVAVVVVKAALA